MGFRNKARASGHVLLKSCELEAGLLCFVFASVFLPDTHKHRTQASRVRKKIKLINTTFKTHSHHSRAQLLADVYNSYNYSHRTNNHTTTTV